MTLTILGIYWTSFVYVFIPNIFLVGALVYCAFKLKQIKELLEEEDG